DHLEDLKRQGTKFVRVDASNVAGLTSGAPRPAAATVPVRPPVGKSSAVAAHEPVKIVSGPAPDAAPIAITASGDKAADIGALRERAMVCVKCPNLASSRKNVVWGVGDINSPIMFVGEAPGADED